MVFDAVFFGPGRKLSRSAISGPRMLLCFSSGAGTSTKSRRCQARRVPERPSLCAAEPRVTTEAACACS
ncbi:uncharacterized [Tachysurus ichikawai]